MGKPLTIQLEDDQRLESLKEDVGARTKIDVLRKALDSLEEKINQQRRRARLARAARAVSKESARVNKEFQLNSILKKEW